MSSYIPRPTKGAHLLGRITEGDNRLDSSRSVQDSRVAVKAALEQAITCIHSLDRVSEALVVEPKSYDQVTKQRHVREELARVHEEITAVIDGLLDEYSELMKAESRSTEE